MYTIKKIAELAGVSTRTLRYYHQMGLLPPAALGENGYRYYDRKSLLKLQQILFLREFDLPLKDIQEILDRPDYDPLQALMTHREGIQKRISRLNQLLSTLDTTIKTFTGDETVEDKDLFAGFDHSRYEGEVQKRWGKTVQYQESQQKWNSYSQKEKTSIQQLGNELAKRMVTDDPEASPDAPDIQRAVAEYHDYLNKYFYTCDADQLRNLADMWADDPRFAVNYESIREGGAAFVREAVHIYCDRDE
jgi:DNA-binding transcriptional MerR regulator